MDHNSLLLLAGSASIFGLGFLTGYGARPHSLRLYSPPSPLPANPGGITFHQLERFPLFVRSRIPIGPRIRFDSLPKLRRLRWGIRTICEFEVIQVVEGGAARAAARQFLHQVDGDPLGQTLRTGSFEAKTNKGQSRSPLRKHEEWLLGLVKQEPDLTLEEIQRRLLAEHQHKAGLGSVWRFFDRHGISFKKKPSRGRAGSA